MLPKTSITITGLKHCARCGCEHSEITFAPLDRPIQDTVWTHWASCPTNGQPILMREDHSGHPHSFRVSAEAVLAEIRNERNKGALLGLLVDKYGAQLVVRALGAKHVSESLGVPDA